MDWRNVAVGRFRSLLVLCAFAFVGPSAAVAQTITEIIDFAGDGTNPLERPFMIAAPASGDVYVAGIDSDNAFRIEPDSTISEIIDSTGDGTNVLVIGYGMAVDAAGNRYVGGHLTLNVFKVSPTGTITQIIDATGDGSNSLGPPTEIVTDSLGNVYVAGLSFDNVFKITPSGTISQIIDATGDGGSNPLNEPKYLAVDAADNIYVSGALSGNVFRITPAGAITHLLDAFIANGIDFDLDQNLYVAFIGGVLKRTPGGTVTQIIDGSGDGTNPLGQPEGLAADRFGNVYVTGRDTDNVFQITASGVISEILDITGDGTNPFDEGGHVAVDDSGSTTIRIYASGLTSDNVFRIELPVPPPPTGTFQNGGFETLEPVSPGTDPPWPDAFADVWQGDEAAIVTMQDGITPFEGTQMLQFISAQFAGGAGPNGGSNMWQIVDAPSVLPSQAIATARFNRVAGDAQTDTAFSLTLVAVSGDPSDFPTKAENSDFLAVAQTDILTGGDIATWEWVTTTLVLPANTDYVGIQIASSENVFNDTSGTEFDGHYADDVQLAFALIGVPALGPYALAALALLVLGAGAAAVRGKLRLP
jgi:sugar lactone lactonase YvrE